MDGSTAFIKFRDKSPEDQTLQVIEIVGMESQDS